MVFPPKTSLLSSRGVCRLVHMPSRLPKFSFAGIYLIVFYVATALSLFRWPIVAYDSDLWYHLASGRYFFTHGRLPDTSFFSFITPARPWIDYFWLFQLLVYGIHSLVGYQGLIILRGLIFLLTASMILVFLVQAARSMGRVISWQAVLAFLMVYWFFLLPRYLLVRPHIFTYLLIVLFLYILEYRRELSWCLPILAVLWCNLHGISFPILVIICAAYFIELVVGLRQSTAEPVRSHRQLLLPIALSIAAIWFTPHGAKLVMLPFTTTAFASRYVGELRPIPLANILDIQISHFTPTQTSLFAFILLAAWVSVFRSALGRRLRLSHTLLLLAGTALLSKGNRFTYEAALLFLPMLSCEFVAVGPALSDVRLSRGRAIAGWVLVFTISTTLLYSMFRKPQKYPVSPQNLPLGVATFLD